MKLKQKTLLPIAILATMFGGLLSFLPANSAYADPAADQVKCADGTKVTATKDMKPDVNLLDDKDYSYACRNHDGYKSADETIVCKDGKGYAVYKDAAKPKNVLDDKDREEACKGHGGIKVDDAGSTNSCESLKTAIIKVNCKDDGNIQHNGIWQLLLLVINILTAGVGVLAVGGIVYGAILYTTAEDKADQVKKATDIITNVIIGLVLFALMWAGLNFLVPGGVFAA